jgi:hypothetical protein
MLMFFRNGDPKISVKMTETKETNPRPINSGDPHLRVDERLAEVSLEADVQFGLWRGDIGTKLEESGFWATTAIVGSSPPIRNARIAHEGRTDHQDDGPGHHRGEDSLEDPRRH